MAHSLEFLISAKMKEGQNQINATKNSLKELGYELDKLQVKMNKSGKQTVTASYQAGLKKITETYDETGKLIKSTDTLQRRSWDTGRLLWYFNILRMVGNKFKSIETSAMDFNETIEKFNVSMGTAADRAQLFQDKMANAIGTSRAEMMNYQANFKNIMAGLGTMSTETAEKISESLTKMSLDYSSLFNTSQSSAANKIQAALVGTIMPIRRESGYDVSRNAVTQKASELGLDRTYSQLTETEKRLIRIMLLMDQMKNTGAFNDLARTIESPANQIKVLKNQVQELGIWLGNVFMGTIGKILPYINGFIMALKEIVKLFAFFVGYEPIATDITEPLEEAAEGADDISSGLGRASGHAKELRKTLQGFDVLNVIQTPTASTGGGGSGGGGVDPALLGALEEYDSLMEKVRMKATDIRDRILEWLGFYSEDGGLTWHLREGETRLRIILDILKEIGVILLGYKLSKAVLNLINLITGGQMSAGMIKMKAAGVSLMLGGLFLVWQGIQHAIEDGDLSAFDLLEILSGGAMTFIGGMMTFGKGVSMKMALGLTMSIAGITLVYGSIKKMINGDFSPETILEALGGGALTVVGGILTFKSILNLNIGSTLTSAKNTLTSAVSGTAGAAKDAQDTLNTVSQKSTLKIPSVKEILQGLADFAIIVGGVVALILAIGALMQIPGVADTVGKGIEIVGKVFAGIGEVILPMTTVGAAMVAMGKLVKITDILVGLAGIAAVLDGIPLLITALGGLLAIPGWSDAATRGIDCVKQIFKGLGEVIVPIAEVCGLVVAMGFAGIIAGGGAGILIGLAGFAAVIGAMELIAVALGGLSQIPGNKEVIEKGFEILKIIGKGIGEFIGSFSSGIISASISWIQDLGTQLANFMTNAKPFFDGLTTIDQNTAVAAGYMAEALLKLAAAKLVEGFSNWFTGGFSMNEFGMELVIFGVYFKEYAEVIKGIDTAVVVASAIAASALAELARSIPDTGGIIAAIAGDNRIDDWGAQLVTFGVFLKAYGKAIKGLDASAVAESATAAMALAELAKSIPDTGGIIAAIAGDNTMDKWGAQLVFFGVCMRAYSAAIAGLDANSVVTSALAAMALASVAKNIPDTGGIISAIAGDNAMDKWGAQLVFFGACLKAYSLVVEGIDPNVVQNSVFAAQSIAELAKNLPSKGILDTMFTGDNSLDAFGARLASFGQSFRIYYEFIKNIDNNKISQITKLLRDIVDLYTTVKEKGIVSVIDDFKNKLRDSAGSVRDFVKNSLSDNDAWWMGYSFGKNIGWGVNAGIRDKISTTIKAFDTDTWDTVKQYSIRAYARGGLPDLGQMFIARENGPELVGQIGGQTAVMNNDQIVAAVSQGVASAVASVMGSQGGSYQLYIDGEQITDVVQKRMNRNANIYGR